MCNEALTILLCLRTLNEEGTGAGRRGGGAVAERAASLDGASLKLYDQVY